MLSVYKFSNKATFLIIKYCESHRLLTLFSLALFLQVEITDKVLKNCHKSASNDLRNISSFLNSNFTQYSMIIFPSNELLTAVTGSLNQ